MRANQTLSTVYTLKEQLQTLWSAPDEAAMREALNQCCALARAATITPLHRYATMLENHANGIVPTHDSSSLPHVSKPAPLPSA